METLHAHAGRPHQCSKSFTSHALLERGAFFNRLSRLKSNQNHLVVRAQTGKWHRLCNYVHTCVIRAGTLWVPSTLQQSDLNLLLSHRCLPASLRLGVSPRVPQGSVGCLWMWARTLGASGMHAIIAVFLRSCAVSAIQQFRCPVRGIIL